MGLVSNVLSVTWSTRKVGYVCPLTGIKINADLNAARNIAKRVGYETPTPRKILSFIITTNGVKPITPKRGNNQDPHDGNLALKGGEGVIPQ